MVFRTVLVGLAGGILFGILDGVIHANPLARRLYEVYKPISRTSLSPVTGIVLDLVFGLAMAGLFLLLHPSLPGHAGAGKGLSFGLLAWFFRVVMQAASQWVMFRVPAKTLLYGLVAGLGEMVALGLLYGLALKPAV